MLGNTRGGLKAARRVTALARSFHDELPRTALQDFLLYDSGTRARDVYERHQRTTGMAEQAKRVLQNLLYNEVRPPLGIDGKKPFYQEGLLQQGAGKFWATWFPRGTERGARACEADQQVHYGHGPWRPSAVSAGGTPGRDRGIKVVSTRCQVRPHLQGAAALVRSVSDELPCTALQEMLFDDSDK